MSPRSWIPSGQPIVVAGQHISTGLVYCGPRLLTGVAGAEPSLIDPSLPVDAVAPDPAPTGPGPCPAYDTLAPATRAAYLRWLAGGRADPRAPAGFALLFLAGLERRVLIDADHDPRVRGDLPAIAAELHRLRTRYAGDAGFRAAAEALLDVVELVGAARVRPGGAVSFATPQALTAAGETPSRRRTAPFADGNSAPIASRDPTSPGPRPRASMSLRIALARSVVTATPIPADWARIWLWCHPTLPTRAAQRRCPREFDRLFELWYTRRHGSGLVPPPAGAPIRITYQPVNPGIPRTVVERPDLPDVLTGARTTAALGRLLDEVSEALAPYSRWLARYPGGRGSLAATALLPDDLIDPSSDALRHLVAWATARLDSRPRVVIDVAELATFWSSADPARMSRDESQGLALVLARMGLGIEPDVRFDGPALTSGPAVLFRPDTPARATAPPPDPSTAPDAGTGTAPLAGAGTAPLAAATGAVDLAAGLVAAVAPDDLDDDRLQTMIDEIVAELGTVTGSPGGPAPGPAVPQPAVPQPAVARLAARLLWRVAVGGAPGRPPVPALPERAATGRFLISIAVNVIGVTPRVVAALVTAYRMLGLDRDLVHTRLIRAAGGDPPEDPVAKDPVVVRPAGDREAGYALPWTNTTGPPANSAPTNSAPTNSAPATGPPANSGFRLDQRILAKRLAETEDVSALLSAIFEAAEDGTDRPLRTAAEPVPRSVPSPRTGLPPPTAAASPTTVPAPLFAGLDPAHGALLHELSTRASWSRVEFVAAAGRHGVLPDGAMDLLNEVAIDAAGEPVVEGDDDLSVNKVVLREMSR